MPSNEFVPFATSSTANVQAQPDYAAAAATQNGFGLGVAQSAWCNKVWRQGSFVAAGVSQFILQQLNVDVHDDGNLSNWVSNFTTAIGHLVGVVSSGVPEAPATGTIYGRRGSDNSWQGPVALTSDLGAYMLAAGGTATNAQVALAHDPVASNDAATKNYVDSHLTALGSGYLPLTGGTLYQPGGANPLTLRTDTGRDNYLIHIGQRTWYAGVSATVNAGYYTLYDATALAARLTIDTAGNVNMPGTVTAGGGLTSGNDLYLSRPQADSYILRPNVAGQKTLRVACSGATPLDTFDIIAANTYARGNLTVTSGVYVGSYLTAVGTLNIGSSGSLYFYDSGSGWIGMGGNLWTSAQIQAGFLHSTGSVQADTVVYVGGITVQNSGGWLHTPSGFYSDSTVQGSSLYSTGDIRAVGNLGAVGLYLNNAQIDANGNATFNGNLWNGGYVQGSFTSSRNGQVTCSSNGMTLCQDWGARLNSVYVDANFLNLNNGAALELGSTANTSFAVFVAGDGHFEIYDNNNSQCGFHVAFGNGSCLMYGSNPGNYSNGNFYVQGTVYQNTSERERKTNIEPWAYGLSAIRRLDPIIFEYDQDHKIIENDDPTRFATLAPGRHISVMADQAADAIPEMVSQPQQFIPGSGEYSRLLNTAALTYTLVNAVKELASRLEAVEGR